VLALLTDIYATSLQSQTWLHHTVCQACN